MSQEKCGIVHKLGSQTCNREKGHDGFCRSKTAARGGGSLMYSEWESRNGEFYRHVGYQSFYPTNMAGRENERT